MTVAPLLAALRREAEAERTRVLAEAHAEAARLDGASRAEADNERAVRLGAEQTRLRAAGEHRLAARRRETRGEVLAARQQLLDRVFARALELLPRAVAEQAYRETLPGRVAQGLASAGDCPVELRCTPSIAAQLRALEAGRGIGIRGDPDIRAGLRLVALDGSLVVDDTLEGALERRRAELSLLVLRDLAELEARAAGGRAARGQPA